MPPRAPATTHAARRSTRRRLAEQASVGNPGSLGASFSVEPDTIAGRVIARLRGSFPRLSPHKRDPERKLRNRSPTKKKLNGTVNAAQGLSVQPEATDAAELGDRLGEIRTSFSSRPEPKLKFSAAFIRRLRRQKALEAATNVSSVPLTHDGKLTTEARHPARANNPEESPAVGESNDITTAPRILSRTDQASLPLPPAPVTPVRNNSPTFPTVDAPIASPFVESPPRKDLAEVNLENPYAAYRRIKYFEPVDLVPRIYKSREEGVALSKKPYFFFRTEEGILAYNRLAPDGGLASQCDTQPRGRKRPAEEPELDLRAELEAELETDEKNKLSRKRRLVNPDFSINSGGKYLTTAKSDDSGLIEVVPFRVAESTQNPPQTVRTFVFPDNIVTLLTLCRPSFALPGALPSP